MVTVQLADGIDRYVFVLRAEKAEVQRACAARPFVRLPSHRVAHPSRRPDLMERHVLPSFRRARSLLYLSTGDHDIQPPSRPGREVFSFLGRFLGLITTRLDRYLPRGRALRSDRRTWSNVSVELDRSFAFLSMHPLTMSCARSLVVDQISDVNSSVSPEVIAARNAARETANAASASAGAARRPALDKNIFGSRTDSE
jgi:hypothetical protein